MKKQLLVGLGLCALTASAKEAQELQYEKQIRAQEKSIVQKATIECGGFVKTDAFWDSRQGVIARDGHLFFFPAAPRLDVNKCDINSNGDFNILAIQTRLFAKITGIDIGKAHTSGIIEGDFFGVSDATINSIRMRHAMMKLAWDTGAFIAGYTNHPIFVDECNSGDTLSFNSGVPFEALSRNPQVRIEYKPAESFRLIMAALSEVDFKSTGPNGFSTEYVRNSQLPIAHVQLQGRTGEQVFGAGIDFRHVRPRLVSTKNYVVDEFLTSISLLAYARVVVDDIVLKGKVIYGSNAVGYLLLGGYGIACVNPVTDERRYTNLKTLSGWLEVTGGEKIKPGIFLGFAKNVGADHCLAPLGQVSGATKFNDLIFGRGQDIDWAWRISPRILWVYNQVQVGAEFEVTQAAYGTVQQNGKVCDACPVTNYRPLFVAYYYF